MCGGRDLSVQIVQAGPSMLGHLGTSSVSDESWLWRNINVNLHKEEPYKYTLSVFYTSFSLWHQAYYICFLII